MIKIKITIYLKLVKYLFLLERCKENACTYKTITWHYTMSYMMRFKTLLY